ncbi:hypothetical protein FHR32_000840 [Streptosporangium album]|uniref:Uncharacterized protein n=1 Tax=Streptosporangium album TaxID=47479 RepID=A0A7W7RQY7_9ACTN|nr:hypothetical protein [Streptosporangium album]MBB4936535.1 hypothetical protein [Streptosporangium album]
MDLRQHRLDAERGTGHSGAVLLSHGLRLDLPRGDHASALVRLSRS